MRKTKHIEDMTIEDFRALPERKWDKEITCTSIIILPADETEELHDSGYRFLDFVAVKGSSAICRLSGISDVAHLDGIGGYGYKWSSVNSGVPKMVRPPGWTIDCLPKSGLLRMWPSSGVIKAGPAMSSIEIFAFHKPNT